MKVTIDFTNDEVEPLIQEHLANGESVQDLIRKAVRLHNKVKKLEESSIFGYCHKDKAYSFKQYNTVLDLKDI